MKLYGSITTALAHKITKTLSGVQCDICGKMIPAENGEHSNNRYFDVMTGHYDWGEDSGESITMFDVCPDCIDRVTSEYLKNARGSAYIEINTEYSNPSDEQDFVDIL